VSEVFAQWATYPAASPALCHKYSRNEQHILQRHQQCVTSIRAMSYISCSVTSSVSQVFASKVNVVVIKANKITLIFFCPCCYFQAIGSQNTEVFLALKNFR
jgi:hypothetical protein